MDDQPSRSPRRVSAHTWWICGFLFVGTALNYLDRQVLALTADKIIADFHLTKESLGGIIGAFRYAYGIGQLFGGFLVDAYGPRFVYPAAGCIWSSAGLLMGLASTAGLLVGFNIILGAGEAFNFPCALKATRDLLRPEERPLAVGIFNSGAPIGALLAPIIVTVLVTFYSWRVAFVATGALGFFWVGGWLWYTRGSADRLRGTPLVLSDSLRVAGRILSTSGFWMLAASAIIINSVNYYLADWVPLYLKTSRGFSFAAGNVLSTVVSVGSSAGSILVGLGVRKLVGWGINVSAAKKWSLLLCCVFMGSAIAAGLTPYRYWAVACLALTAVGMAGFMVIYMTLVQDLDPAHVGVTSGLLGGLGNLVYGYFSPYIGKLADLHKTFLLFMLIGVMPWLAFLAIVRAIKEEDS